MAGTTVDERLDPTPDPGGGGDGHVPRRLEPAGQVLVAMLVCLLLWALVSAPSLKANAEASPFGARRTAALAVLTPLSAISHALGLARLDARAETALGRPDPLAPPPTVPPVTPLKRRAHATPLPPLRTPTRSQPLHVLVLGDSTALDLGYGLERAATPAGRYRVTLDGRISTGLARLDYFNWLAQAQKDVARYRPDIVVVLLGLNDLQDFRAQSHYLVRYTRPWIRAYAQRVNAMLAEVVATGRRVLWVGEPIVSNRNIAYGLRVVNKIYRNVTHGVLGVSYVDSWHLFVNSQGRYAAYLRNASGDLQQVREADGEHLTPAGQDRMGQYVLGIIRSLSSPAASTPSPPVSPTPHASRSGPPT
ncbi:MAG TPA: DUF459 domain-containing protein [Actinomycetota bacterium]|jgi:hypothetical protein